MTEDLTTECVVPVSHKADILVTKSVEDNVICILGTVDEIVAVPLI